MAMIPQWNERISNKDIDGEDHLGVETAAITEQGNLLPGIITVTDHARYFSLYCWILWRFIHDERHDRRLKNLRGVYFKRMELAHTMAAHAHHLDGENFGGVIGNQRSGVIWRASDPIDLDGNIDRYFQNTLGGFGQYYLTAMRLLGLVGDKPNQSDVYQLTERGLQLAEAFDASINQTSYYSNLQQSDVQTLSYNDALDYGVSACLCAEALSKGKDRDLLREILFRLDDGTEIRDVHRVRQLSLALLLDMVRQSGDISFRETMRSTLYLGDYTHSQSYKSSPSLTSIYESWRNIQVRQLFTNSLQILWRIFLNYLQDESVASGITFDEFIDWLRVQEKPDFMDTPVIDYIQQKMNDAGCTSDWRECESYIEATKFKDDALTIFDGQLTQKNFTVSQALAMLMDIFLRFYDLHKMDNVLWREIAVATQESHRLPMRDFFTALEIYVDDGRTFDEVIRWLYQDYILSQHEYMAIRKLRYNEYDTFKFHYVEGRFYRTAKRYDQPIRHPALRLDNALTMLIDVGLVVDEAGIYHLSSDGERYLKAVEDLADEY